jgi:hypothetical protein
LNRQKEIGDLLVFHFVLRGAILPKLSLSHSFLRFLNVLHIFTSNYSQADVPKAKTEYSGFTILWAKILLNLAEWEASLISLLASKPVLDTNEAYSHTRARITLPTASATPHCLVPAQSVR